MDYFQQAAGTAGVAGSTGGAATASAAVQQPNLNMSDEMKRQLLIQQQQELQFQQQRLEQQLLQLQQKQMMGKLQQRQSQLRQQQQRQNRNQKVVPNQQPAATKLGNINSTNNASNFNSLFGTLSKIVGSFENPSAFDAYDAFSSAAASASATAAASVSAGPVVDNSFPMIGLNNNSNNNQELPQEEQNHVPLPRPNKRRRVATAAEINPTSSPYPPASRVGGKKTAVATTAVADMNAGGDGDDSGDEVNRFRHYQADQWSTMLEELLSFKRKFGHCNVPHTSKEFPTLGRWVKRQRYQYKIMMDGKKESTMTPARVQVLERAGFIFDSHGSSWAQRFAELQQFKVEFGHCNVPSPYQSNPALSNWTKFQRRQIKKGLLSQDRIDALDAIGFHWELRKANKSSSGATTTNISTHGVDI